jgi:putative ABC transport system ATP-binding protein
MQLVATDICHWFSSVRVLNNVSINVRRGEAVAVVGPSGSGKTTLLSIVGELLSPTSGEVVVRGDSGTMYNNVGRYVAWIHQTTNGLMSRPATDNVALGYLATGGTHRDARERAGELLNIVGLEGFGNLSAAKLSGGQLQRVAIARALATEAPFILADEPTGQLDVETSELVVDLLVGQAAHTFGQAIIVATHDPVVASRCDRILRLGESFPEDGI